MKPAAQDPAWRCAGRCIPRAWAALAIVAALLALLPLLNLAYSPGHPLHVSSYAVALLGKFMCYALAALALDLVWGYAGILSLGHGLFFALGGYAHGMYLMRAIGRDGAYQSTLPDFMVFLDWKSYPWYWSYTEHFWYAMLLVVLVPGALAFCSATSLSLAHQGRVLLHHHAGADLRGHAAVLPQRHRLRRQ